MQWIYLFFSKLKGISGFISAPHFLNADKSFLENIDGLKPNETIHDTIMEFEPVSFEKCLF